MVVAEAPRGHREGTSGPGRGFQEGFPEEVVSQLRPERREMEECSRQGTQQVQRPRGERVPVTSAEPNIHFIKIPRCACGSGA